MGYRISDTIYMGIIQFCKLLCSLLPLFQIAWMDIREHKIPDRLLARWFGIGLITLMSEAAIRGEPLGLYERIFGLVGLGLPFLLLCLLRPGAFGGGDIKLLAIAGWFLGIKMGILALGAAFLPAGVYSLMVWLKQGRKENQTVVLGPFLCFGIGLLILLINYS